MYDIIIIGAGIIGTAVARRLSRYKLNICLLDKENDVSMGATKANSAIVHGGYAEANSKQKGRMCYAGRVQYSQLNKELNFGFREIGSLVITQEESDLAKLEAMKENGILNGLRDLEIITHDRIVELEPNVNENVKYALYCKGAGICSPYEMAIALAENAVKNGVEICLNQEATAITKNADGTLSVKTNDNIRTAKYVINCSGIYGSKVSKLFDDEKTDFTITPRVGEYILMARGTASHMKTVVFQMPTKMGKGILVTPTVHGNLLMGPDAIDTEGDADCSTHLERLEHIYRSGLNTTSKLDIRTFIRSFAGARAVSSTDDFIIDFLDKDTRKFLNLVGIQSPGLTAAPAIADKACEMLKDAGLELIEDETYDPYRAPIIEHHEFLSLKDAKVRVELPETDDSRFVCRCEQVTQSVIKDACSRGLPINSLDAIKRRTRAGMGFCQGEFCGPRVKELLKREFNIEVDGLRDIEAKEYSRVKKDEFIQYIKARDKEILDKQ